MIRDSGAAKIRVAITILKEVLNGYPNTSWHRRRPE
jgi:hypothetical protein